MYGNVTYTAARDMSVADVYSVVVCTNRGNRCAVLGYYIILILRTIVLTVALGEKSVKRRLRSLRIEAKIYKIHKVCVRKLISASAINMWCHKYVSFKLDKQRHYNIYL